MEISPLIGIKPLIVNEDFLLELKRDLLIFKSVGIYQLDIFLNYDKWKQNSELIQELRFLRDNNFIFNAHTERITKLKSSANIAHFQELHDELRKIKASQLIDYPTYLQLQTRLTALSYTYKEEKGFEAIPILNNFLLPDEEYTKKANVLRLIINEMPLPKMQTAWEDIISFKNDQDNIGKFFGLKNWINKINRSSNSIGEIQDELRDLLYQYERSLKLHKIKFTNKKIAVILPSPMEMLTDPWWLKLIKAGAKLFNLKEEKANLLNMELSAPGRELAYITSAKQTFSN